LFPSFVKDRRALARAYFLFLVKGISYEII
jgi:hypothetical protein